MSAAVRDATAADLAGLAQLLDSRPCPGDEAPDDSLGALCGNLPGDLPGGDAGNGRWLVAADAAGLLACARLCPPVGLQQPRYWYHLGTAVHAAAGLQFYRRHRTLLLGNDLTGSHLLAGLAMAPGDDGQPLPAAPAALQALVRAAAAAAAAEPGASRLIAELPGVRDSAGQSPFWQGLGRHFYRGDPAAAAARHGAAWRSHVAALLPRQLLYTAFLPEAAQAAIGTAHPGAAPLLQVLQAAGLRPQQHLRIDDGGPVLELPLD